MNISNPIPQRFFTFDYDSKYDGHSKTTIDLSKIIEISLLSKDDNYNTIIIITLNNCINIQLDKNEVGEELYNKLVNSWVSFVSFSER